MYKYFPLNFLLGVLLVSLFGLSCTPQKDTRYFNTVPVNSEIQTLISKDFEAKVRVGDVLTIGIYATSERIGLYNSSADGYLVDKKGTIQLYNVGDVRVEGLTLEQVKQKIKATLEPDYLKNVSVSARFKNHRVIMLGEIGTPGVIPMETESLSLLEAISQKGDLRVTARRDNVLVIRNTERGKIFYRVNLLDGSIFNSNFYYLQADDIVYVEPEPKKKNANVEKIINYTISAASFILLLSSRIK